MEATGSVKCLVSPLIAACLAFALRGECGEPAPDEPKCSQKHVGRQHRLESVAKRGDARMAKSAAGHAVAYAVERFRIADLVTEQDRTRATGQMYSFLKWKLGNPTAIAGQFITAGYQHFDKAYSDEAAAALLGFGIPGESGGQAEFQMPAKLVDLWLLVQQKVGIPLTAAVLEAEYGIPAALSGPVLQALAKVAAKQAKKLGFNMPKKFDFPNKLIHQTIRVLRDPAGAQADLEKALRAAATPVTKPAGRETGALPPSPEKRRDERGETIRDVEPEFDWWRTEAIAPAGLTAVRKGDLQERVARLFATVPHGPEATGVSRPVR